ncbi:hypothetical protein E2562_023975 [Oryza meyeriana var. granulata]|uniref:E3 ubiquitin-protein ligase synoviolin-like TPR repeats domain-containing protein n=1 Tax=Oryza meyeriana var. granulata TaxID=110450 RepID=A0A6G1BYD7_9ORYZ|nr:hypothetical protein E2562_023975 [Oryza meyeriana var. granulata]KAF0893345.1 hypothetical protein E2562_023975 [Oryza meyeriana var. granulata]
MTVAYQLIKHISLGSLCEAEVERLNKQLWREIVEILFVVSIFRLDFSVLFLAMVAMLLLVMHCLTQKWIEYIEVIPSVPTLSHVRIMSFIVFLLAVTASSCPTHLNGILYLLADHHPWVCSFYYLCSTCTCCS